ncbi:VirB3 family type IV secretion system protein [Bordetella petrii]|uniref:type IV secretion system protein VirB3 n=1 Tax=Bordetella petrii TaxID=94624 RepID=UPI0009DD0C74
MAVSPKPARPAQEPQPAAQPSSVPPFQYPLFKGATRVATIKGGVPTRPFLALVFLTVTVAMFTLWGWLIGPILYPVLAVLSRNDDRAFWIWELWLRTKFLAPNKRFWEAISLTPTPYAKRRYWCRHHGAIRK